MECQPESALLSLRMTLHHLASLGCRPSTLEQVEAESSQQKPVTVLVLRGHHEAKLPPTMMPSLKKCVQAHRRHQACRSPACGSDQACLRGKEVFHFTFRRENGSVYLS